MNEILLIGGGGHCRACIDVIESTDLFRIAGIVQPTNEFRETVIGYSVLGTDDELPSLLRNIPMAHVTVGQIKSFQVRKRLFKQMQSLGAQLPIIRSPIAYLSRRAVVGPGSILMHGCVVNVNASIGVNCIINNLALVEHDVRIEDYCHISTGARVNGNVRIGKGCFIGSGAILREGISIGEGCIISAGQVVMKDVPAGTILKGRHA